MTRDPRWGELTPQGRQPKPAPRTSWWLNAPRAAFTARAEHERPAMEATINASTRLHRPEKAKA